MSSWTGTRLELKQGPEKKLLRDQGARGPHIDLEEEGGQGLDEDAELQAALHQSTKSMNLCSKLGHDMIGVADRDVVVVLIEGVVV